MFWHVVANVYAVMGHGACRLSSKTDVGTQGVDYTIAAVPTVAECKSLCDKNADCVAIGVRNTGTKSMQCQLWTAMPNYTSGANISPQHSCHRKEPPRSGWAVLYDHARSPKYLCTHNTCARLPL